MSNQKHIRLLAGAVVGLLLADGVSAQTLDESLAAAYNTNPSLLARRARLRATDEGVPQALAGWRPTVSLTGSGGKEKISTNANSGNAGIASDTLLTPVTGTLSVSQPLYRGGRTIAGTNSAEALVLSERASLLSAEQAVLLTAGTAYLDVLQNQSVLDLNRNNEQVLQRELQAARDRFAVGEITRTDVSQAEARVAQALADRIQADATLQTSRARYQDAVGFLPEKLGPPNKVVELPASLDVAVAQANKDNPAVVAAVWAQKSAEYGIDLVRGELLPTVSLTGEAVKARHASTTDSDTVTYEALVSVTVPLYESGSVYSRVRAQKQTFAQRQSELDDARRSALDSTTQYWETWQAARARVKSYSAQIKANEVALEGVQREAQVGSRTVLDVLNAEQELLTSRVNLVRAQHDESLTSYQLKSAVGQFTAAELALPVELYDPAAYYRSVRGKWIGTDIDSGRGAAKGKK